MPIPRNADPTDGTLPGLLRAPGAVVLLTAGAYYAAARLGLSLASIAPQVTLVWPPTGLALALVLLLGDRVWPGIAVGAFFANLATGAPTGVAAGIAAGNTAEALVGAWLLGRVGFRPALDRVRDALALIVLGGFGSTLVSATIGVVSLCAGGLGEWSHFVDLWSIWWFGDAGGDLVMAPVLLAWAAHWRTLRDRLAETALVLGATVVMSLAAFAHTTTDLRDYPLQYTVFPFVAWAAMRLGQAGTTAVTFIVSAIAIWSTAHQLGPFAVPTVHESLVLLQLFMSVVACTGLLLGAAIAERDAAEARRAADYAALQVTEQHLRLALEAGHQRADELTTADRRKDEFLAMLAHELRNPLAPLSTSLHLLARGVPGRERFIEMADRQVKHLVRLVDDLLDVSRITRGKIRLRKEPVALADVIGRAVEQTRSLVSTRGHTLGVTLPPEPVRLDADAVRLAQVFANLLGNAATYTPAGGTIRVDAEARGTEVVVRVRDTGVGLSPDLLPRVFDLFVQGDASLDRTRGGLGIGLTLSRALVELHGGRIEAHSEGLGRGSEFVVTLPALPATEPAAVDVAPPAARAAQTGLRVLVVEDNHDGAESLAAILELSGHTVRIALDGLAALKTLEAFAPDVVISDLGLPGMDGFALARQIRQMPAHERAVLIALSGYGRDEDRRMALDAGFDHHLVKPPDPDVLLGLVARLAADRAGEARRTLH